MKNSACSLKEAIDLSRPITLAKVHFCNASIITKPSKIDIQHFMRRLSLHSIKVEAGMRPVHTFGDSSHRAGMIDHPVLLKSELEQSEVVVVF